MDSKGKRSLLKLEDNSPSPLVAAKLFWRMRWVKGAHFASCPLSKQGQPA